MTPPNILNDNAANVPVLQLSVGGAKFSEQQLTIAQPTLFVPNWLPYKARPFHCLTAPRPAPYRWTSTQTSCKPITSRRKKWPTRSINKDRQTRKREYDVLINGSTNTISALNNLPVKQVNGTTIYVLDVANVRDGYTPQVNRLQLDQQHRSYRFLFPASLGWHTLQFTLRPIALLRTEASCCSAYRYAEHQPESCRQMHTMTSVK